ncbi:MAG: helix-hairpin-helix domain-containing protein, partial [bacterium]
MTNQEVANILQEMSLFYQMEGVSFKPQAYERASESILNLGEELAVLWKKEGRTGLKKISGVGPAIAAHLETLLRGKLFPEYLKFKKKYPIDVLELTSLGGLGPKTLKTLYSKLKIKNSEDLERALRRDKFKKIPGFGDKSRQNLLTALELRKNYAGRWLLGDVLPLSRELEEKLRDIPGVKRVATAGSIRRRQETIGDI